MPFLDWINKNQAIDAAKDVPYYLLKREKSSGNDSENLLIQGDNLLALKALTPFYSGKVKCIYIDPPYNTQSAFQHYDDKLEHSQWLTMMHPRLMYLRELLSGNGSIWVSVDDNEAHYLKVLMDEIFGRQNFLSSFIWKKSYGGGSKAKWVVGLHEHILCYAKDIDQLQRCGFHQILMRLGNIINLLTISYPLVDLIVFSLLRQQVWIPVLT